MVYKFKKGRHAGKTFEQVAFKDYPLLVWFYDTFKHTLPNKVKENLEDIFYLLNNFESPLECVHCKKNNIKYLSIALKHDGYSYQMSAGIHYAYCSKECWKEDSILALEGGAKLWPVKYNILLEFPPFPKWIRRDLQTILNQCIGFDKRNTEKNAREFFENLKKRFKNPYQQNLFDGV